MVVNLLPDPPAGGQDLHRLRAERGTQAADLLEREPDWARHFEDLRFEWRRWFSEILGTFFLVVVAVGRCGRRS